MVATVLETVLLCSLGQPQPSDGTTILIHFAHFVDEEMGLERRIQATELGGTEAHILASPTMSHLSVPT